MKDKYFEGFEGDSVTDLAEKMNKHMKEYNLQILQVTYQIFGSTSPFGGSSIKHYALTEFADKIDNL